MRHSATVCSTLGLPRLQVFVSVRWPRQPSCTQLRQWRQHFHDIGLVPAWVFRCSHFILRVFLQLLVPLAILRAEWQLKGQLLPNLQVLHAYPSFVLLVPPYIQSLCLPLLLLVDRWIPFNSVVLPTVCAARHISLEWHVLVFLQSGSLLMLLGGHAASLRLFALLETGGSLKRLKCLPISLLQSCPGHGVLLRLLEWNRISSTGGAILLVLRCADLCYNQMLDVFARNFLIEVDLRD